MTNSSARTRDLSLNTSKQTRKAPIRGVVFNTESAYWYTRDRTFRDIVDSASFLTCDGVGLQFSAKILGVNLPRFHGPDLMHIILTKERFKRIFILGGNDEALINIKEKYEKNGKEIEGDIGRIEACISESGLTKITTFAPDVVFVCLGLRKQEVIAEQLQHEMADCESLIIGVGASVDFLGSTKKRASKMVQSIGLEWLPRLIREPRMLVRVLRSFWAIPLILFGRVDVVRNGNFIQALSDLKNTPETQNPKIIKF